MFSLDHAEPDDSMCLIPTGIHSNGRRYRALHMQWVSYSHLIKTALEIIQKIHLNYHMLF